MKYDLNEMDTLDLYLSNLSNEEYQEVKANMGTQGELAMPLLSWDLFTERLHQDKWDALKRSELKQVLTFAKQFNWSNDVRQLFSENDYEALIVTDKTQKIIWVNDGFTTMTGYSKSDAVDKTPRFLQGPKTSVRTKNRIRAKIAKELPFKDIIINHRKDRSMYKCEVKIVPLFSEETTHYIAFEKEVG